MWRHWSVVLSGSREAWLAFFVEAVRSMAQQAVVTANRLSTLIREDREKLNSIGRLAGSALRVLDVLAQRPVVSPAAVGLATGMAASTVSKVMNELASKGLVRELTGQKRNRVFSYDRYLKVLEEGTEPLT